MFEYVDIEISLRSVTQVILPVFLPGPCHRAHKLRNTSVELQE
jgi:hypothetical protein